MGDHPGDHRRGRAVPEISRARRVRHDERIRQAADLLHDIEGGGIERRQGVEAMRFNVDALRLQFPERVDDAHGLPHALFDAPAAMPASGSGHGGILALGIDHERRPRPCQQIGDDGRAALAAPACGYGDEVPVIRTPDDPAGGIHRAAEQQLPFAVTVRPIVEQAAETGRAAHADEARAHEAGERRGGLADEGFIPRYPLQRHEQGHAGPEQDHKPARTAHPRAARA